MYTIQFEQNGKHYSQAIKGYDYVISHRESLAKEGCTNIQIFDINGQEIGGTSMKIKITYTNNKTEIANYPHITNELDLDRIGYGIKKLNGVKSVTMIYNNQSSFTLN